MGRRIHSVPLLHICYFSEAQGLPGFYERFALSLRGLCNPEQSDQLEGRLQRHYLSQQNTGPHQLAFSSSQQNREVCPCWQRTSCPICKLVTVTR